MSPLDELHATTTARVASLLHIFDGVVEAQTNVATDDEHDPEGHTIAWERQQIAALLHEARNSLIETEAAQRRVEAGSYGRCALCAREITAERLDALPATPTCVACAG